MGFWVLRVCRGIMATVKVERKAPQQGTILYKLKLCAPHIYCRGVGPMNGGIGKAVLFELECRCVL